MSFLQDQIVLLGILCCIFLLTNEIQCYRYNIKTVKEGIQLVEGDEHCRGHLQVKSNGTWLYVCHLKFTAQNAFVACRDLECGFPRIDRTWIYPGEIDSWSGTVNCSGQEQHLTDCPAAPLDSDSGCRPTVLWCSDKPEHPDVEIYSWGGSGGYSSLDYDNPYVVVCSIDTPFKVQSFVLRLSVHSGPMDRSDKTEWSQPAVDNAAYFFSPLKNKGFSFSCQYNFEFQPETFSHGGTGDVSFRVIFNLRLVGGESRCLGSLELEYGEWRAVNQQLWSLKEAAVVCRQLHCGSVISTDTQSRELQPVWRFYSDCDGSETGLQNCGTISKGESVSTVHVLCSDILDPASISLKAQKNSRVDSMIVYSPYGFYITCSVTPRFAGGHFSLVFTGDNLSVTVNQTAVKHSAVFTFSLSEKAHSGNYSCIYHNTVSGHDFSSQSQNITISIKDAEELLLDDGVSQGFGSSACSGTLLVKDQSQALMVTAETLRWDMRHASIVCRQLRCGSAVSTYKTQIPKVTPMWRFLSDCDGSEAALLQCGQVQKWFSSQAITVDCEG